LHAQLRRGVWHVLIKWAGLLPADAAWEPLEDFRVEFPTFQLEDKLFAEGGGVMLWSAEFIDVVVARLNRVPSWAWSPGEFGLVWIQSH